MIAIVLVAFKVTFRNKSKNNYIHHAEKHILS